MFSYKLPEGTFSSQQAENSTLGILGWAKYAEGLSDVEPLHEWPDTSGKIIIKAKLADCIDVDEKMFPVLKPVETQKSHLGLMTRPEIPPVSVIVPSSPEDWEEIEITVDSGACDTVFPSRMLPGV